MRITMDDGIGLAVEVAGSGPGLLLVHGFGGAKEDFADHVPALARENTVVVFDHRGHGASDKPDDPAAYSLERLATDTLLVADAVGLDTFRLLGHSMGGMVARKLVIREPARVPALIMMDTAAGPIPGFDAELMDLASDLAMAQGKAALKELLDLAPALDTAAYQRTLRERPGYQEFENGKWNDLSVVMWATLVRALAYQTDDLPALAAALRGPLLVLVGEQDTPFITAAAQMREAIPTAQVVVIPDAGHSPQFENPDAWIGALSGFLASLPAPAA
jgi:2-succinyl-6-hydroxy-2,4-cyclohexadiene-1-carboxylate synthase